jgi:hypothetical protein
MSNYDNNCTTCQSQNCDCTPPPNPDCQTCPECPPSTCTCPVPCPAIPAGTFVNATITVNATGCIESIQSGNRVIQQRPEPCTSATTTSPCECDIDLNPSQDNLLNAGTTTELYAKWHFDNSASNVVISGSGTAASPVRINYTAPPPTSTFTPTWVNGVAVQTPLVKPVVGTSNTADIDFSVTGGVISAVTKGINFGTATDDYHIVDGLVKKFVAPTSNAAITASLGVKKVGDDFQLDWPQIAPVRSTSLIGVSSGSAFVNPVSGSLSVGQSFSFGSVSLYGDRVYYMAGANANFYNSSGTLITTKNNDYVAYPTPAIALAAYLNVHTFAII